MQATNWAGNVTYGAGTWLEPQSLGELRSAVLRADGPVRTVGTRHSFNEIGVGETLISLARMPGAVEVDRAAMVATVPTGWSFAQVAEAFAAEGIALHAMASLPHISVGGTIATATHGSGDRAQVLSAAVNALEIVTAEGDVRTVSRSEETFAGMVVSLGALGIVTRVTFDVQPSYELRQVVYRHLSWEQLETNFDAITALGQSVSLFTDYRADIDEVWVISRVEDDQLGRELFGAIAASEPVHPVSTLSPDNVTKQLGVPGPWHERLPHFLPDIPPASGSEIQSEYFIARADAIDAINAVRPIAERLAGVLMVSEIRTIAADDLWLSPAYRRDVVGLHFTWHPDMRAIRDVLPVLEDALAPFDALPHWGKVCGDAAGLVSRYSQAESFRALVREWDPAGRFRNDWLTSVLEG